MDSINQSFEKISNISEIIIANSSGERSLNFADKEFLTPEETGVLLGVKPSTLAKWRFEKIGPQYILMNDKLVRYRKIDLDEYMNSLKIKCHPVK